MMRYDTPTKLVSRTIRGREIPGPALNYEHHRRVGIAEHKRFERDVEVLFERSAIRKRNVVNKRFVRLFTVLTFTGGVILFILT